MMMMKKMAVAVMVLMLVVFVLPALPAEAKAKAKTVVEETVNGYQLKVTQSKGTGTKVLWNGRVYGWYDFNGNVKIVPERKLTRQKLIARKDKVLYIEKIVGVVTTKNLDGRTTRGNYISYRCLKGKVKRGDWVITYCVYSPYTRWVDDVQLRFDVPTKYQR